MEKELKLIKLEFCHRMAEALPVPAMAYGLCEDENREVLLVYEEEQEAA